MDGYVTSPLTVVHHEYVTSSSIQIDEFPYHSHDARRKEDKQRAFICISYQQVVAVVVVVVVSVKKDIFQKVIYCF